MICWGNNSVAVAARSQRWDASFPSLSKVQSDADSSARPGRKNKNKTVSQENKPQLKSVSLSHRPCVLCSNSGHVKLNLMWHLDEKIPFCCNEGPKTVIRQTVSNVTTLHWLPSFMSEANLYPMACDGTDWDYLIIVNIIKPSHTTESGWFRISSDWLCNEELFEDEPLWTGCTVPLSTVAAEELQRFPLYF